MFADVATSRPTPAPWRRAGLEAGFELAWGISRKTVRSRKVKRGLRLNMANNPKKVKDPTEDALSAIQEALNISDVSNSDSGRDRDDGRDDMMSTGSSPPVYNDPPFDTRSNTDRPIFDQIEEPRSTTTRRAANDDRETIGQILQAIQKGRPARSAFTLASLFTVVWVIGAALLTFSFLPSLQAAMGQGGGGTLARGGRAA